MSTAHVAHSRVVAGEAATSTDWLRRGAVALSDDVQPWILRRLLDDEDNVVRQLAIWRLQRLTLQEGARSDHGA